MKEEKAFQLKERLQASAIHLAVSFLVVLLAAWFVFALWYPYPYREISGGREMFFIIVTVDVLIGPVITFTVFNRTKSRDELIKDLGIVGLVQLAALFYGMWTVCVARPVHLVFEFDRFRVIHAVEVPEEMLSQTPNGIDALPLTGPTLLAVRPFRDANEQADATLQALQGVHLSARPDLWQEYSQARERVLTSAQLVTDLKQRLPERLELIDRGIRRTGKTEDALLYLPVISRDTVWTVLLDMSDAGVLGFIELDTF